MQNELNVTQLALEPGLAIALLTSEGAACRLQLTVESARDLACTLLADMDRAGAWADHPQGEIVSYAHRLAFSSARLGGLLSRGRMDDEDQVIILSAIKQAFAALETLRSYIQTAQEGKADGTAR